METTVRRVKNALLLCALACSGAPSATAQQPWHIAPGSSNKVRLTCTGTFTNGSQDVADLVLYSPVPPDIPGQTEASLKVVVQGALEDSSKEVPEGSEQHRMFEQTLIRAQGPITVTWIYSATLTARQVVHGSAVAPASVSAENSRQIQQADIIDGEMYDLNSPAYRSFFQKYGVAKRPGESVAAYEWRNFLGVRSLIHYDFIEGQDHRLSYLLSLPTLETDCGGFSAFGVADSLANGIAARTRNGRWIIPGSKDNATVHVQFDFFDPQSSDWWITDATVSQGHSAGELPAYFGNWRPNFLTMMTGTDAQVDSIFFGTKTVTWGQGPVWWYRGGRYTASFSWKAEISPVAQ